MSFGNGYNGYNGYNYQPPVYGGYNYQPQAPQVQQTNTNKIYATSIEDVRARQLPANSDFIFLDNDKPLIYRKTTDATGKMEIQVFKIVPYQEEEPAPVDMSQYVLKSDFDELKKEIAALDKSFKSLKKTV